MRITDARVIVTCPDRNFVTLKISTDAGLTGVGDATLNGRELAVASYLTDHVGPALIGRDPAMIEDTWQYLYKGAYWRRGPVTMSAIAAVDTALWDIKGKVAGLPVYQLLGGRSRTGVTVYGHANGETTEDVLREVAGYVARGYRAVRVQAGIPGLPTTYGVAQDAPFYEPADAAVPSEAIWSTERYLAHIPTVFAAVRDEFGPTLRLLHDVHHRLTPIEAARLGKSLEPFALTWMEDPVGLQEYMPHTPATDEVFPHGYRFADGSLHPSEEPGLGVDIDEELAAKYPYRPASLPINRLEDGTVHSW